MTIATKPIAGIEKRKRSALRRLLMLCSLLTAATFSAAAAAAPVVLVVGDSLSAAYGLPEKAGWVNLLRERLAKQATPYEVANASISGDTTRGGVARIEATLRQYKPEVVIIELGGNDGLRGLSIIGTRNNLDSMVSAVKQAGAKTLLVGVEIPPNYGPVYTKQFSQTFQYVAKKYDVPLVPSILGSFSEKRELFQSDGIHPIASAQPMMLETVWKELAPLLDDKLRSTGTHPANNRSMAKPLAGKNL